MSSIDSYQKELRDDVQHWIEAVQREQAKKRKRSGGTLVVPPELPEGIFRIAWVTDVVFDGNHHIPSPRYLRLVDRPAASFLIYPRTIASFDFSEMTRLVVAAHEAAVRVEIGVGGFRELELFLYARERQGGMAERHPDLDTAVSQIRSGSWSRCPFPVPSGSAT